MKLMTCCLSAFIVCVALAGGARAEDRDNKGKACTMEQQCRWENFKKICTWVKVCR
jgi:hypothetical protein